MNDQELYDAYILGLRDYADAVPMPEDPSADAFLPWAENRTKYALHVVAMAAQGKQLEYA